MTDHPNRSAESCDEPYATIVARLGAHWGRHGATIGEALMRLIACQPSGADVNLSGIDRDLIVYAMARTFHDAQGAVEPTDLPDGWEYQKDTNSVVCGGCAFRYGVEHSGSDGSWTCPNCGNGSSAAQPPAAPVGKSNAGFFGNLTPEQQKTALEYDGPENHGDPAYAHSSAGNVNPRFTVINNSVFDRHERRTIAHFNLWNGTTEEMRQIVEGAHAATAPQGARLTGASDLAPLADRWPLGCHSPNSCSRNSRCMYVGCKHNGKDIGALASAVTRPQSLTGEA